MLRRGASVSTRSRVGLSVSFGLVFLFSSAGFPAVTAGASVVATRKVPADYPTIQMAVNAASPGDTIAVAAGTFTEQVTIAKNLTLTGAGGGSTTIKAPSTLVAGPIAGQRSIVTVSGGAQVAITDLTVAGPGTSPCDSDNSLNNGLFVAQGATLDLHSAAVIDVHNTPILSCNHTGTGIKIGLPSFVTGGPTSGHATITNVLVSNYTNAGIDLLGPATATIVHNRITDLGQISNPTLGVSLNFGAVATVVNNVITDNRCDSPDFQTSGCGSDPASQFQSSGIGTTFAGAGTVIANNRLSNNDIGIYLVFSPNCCRVNSNTLTDNRFFGEAIQDGDNSISHDLISGGQVGVGVIADAVDTTGTLRNVTITGTSVAPTQDISFSPYTARTVLRP